MPLARQKVTDSIFDSSVPPYMRMVSGGTVYVYEVGTSTPVNVYAAQSGGSPLSQPLSSDSTGTFSFWTAPGPVDLVMSGTGLAPVTRTIMVPADPGELLSLEAAAAGYVATTGDQNIAGTKTFTGGVVLPSGTVMTLPTITDLRMKGPQHDVLAYGAPQATGINGGSGLWEGSDASAAFQSAHDAAVADGGWVYFSGVYVFENPINWNPNVPLIGINDSGSRIIPGTGCNGKPVLEVCGIQQGHATWMNFGIGDVAMPGRPSCAFVFAETAAHANSSSEHLLMRVKVDGYYTMGGAVLTAFASSAILDCIFHNKYDATGKSGLLMDNQGESSVASAFGHTFRTGAAVSDIYFGSLEAHDDSQEADQYGIVINGAGDLLFDKCIIGSAGQACVAVLSGAGDIVFIQPNFYSPDAGGAAQNAIYQAEVTTVKNIAILGGTSTINGAVIGGVQSCYFNGLLIKSHRVIDGPGAGTPIMVSLAGNGGTIDGAEIDCQGLAVNVGSTSGQIHGILFRPGTVTAATRNTLEIGATGAVRSAAGFTAAAGGVRTLSYGYAATKVSTPSAPTSGDSLIYPKSDEHWYRQTSGGSEVELLDKASSTIGARVYHNASQNVAASTEVTLAFNSERWDDASFHDTATNNGRLTIPSGQGGEYEIGCSIRWAGSDGTGTMICQIRVNGTTSIVQDNVPASTSNVTHNLKTVWRLSPGDYVTIVVAQFTGTDPLGIDSASAVSPEFWLKRLSA